VGYQTFEQEQVGGRQWLSRWQAVGPIKKISVHGDNITSSLNSYTVAVVAERCAIQTRFITGYGLDQRENLFRLDRFPALSRIDVRLPAQPEALRRAYSLLLGSLVLHQWVYLGGERGAHQFSYTVPHPQIGFPEARQWHASRDLQMAVQELAHAPGVMDAIEMKLLAYLRDRRGAAATEVRAACELLNGLMLEPGQPSGSVLPWNLDNVTYEAALAVLLDFCARFDIMDGGPTHPYARYVKQGQITDGGSTAHHDGWYCTRCGYSFGLAAPRLGDGAGCPIPTCRNPFGPQRG
jgi:hypothetical protein